MESHVKPHEGYLQILKEMEELHRKKSQDYGSEKDTFSNIRESAQGVKIEPWRAAILRMLDKVHRIERFCQVGGLHNESVEDTLLDLASYAMIALALRREKKEGSDAGGASTQELPEPPKQDDQPLQDYRPGGQ